MIPKEVNKKLALIETFELPEESIIESSEQTREQMMKRQNRGKVLVIGEGDTFYKIGDEVSYFRAAATDIEDKETGKIYQLVNDVHVLVKW